MRLIRVLHNYGGHITSDQRIEPGLYPEDDSRLFGAADYLLRNGHAELAGVLADPPTIVEETPPPADEGGEQAPAEETGGEDVSPAGEAPVEETPPPKRKR